jgi:hypothetical protein
MWYLSLDKEIQREMKKFFVIGLLAVFGITASAMAYAAFPANGQTAVIEKVAVPSIDDNPTASRKCPPFCI